MTSQELITAIADKLATKYENQPSYNYNILHDEVEDAYNEIRAMRGYDNTSLSEDAIVDDLSRNYATKIKNLATIRFAKIGGDFESSHSENGTSRTWMSEEDILGTIPAFVKVL